MSVYKSHEKAADARRRQNLTTTRAESRCRASDHVQLQALAYRGEGVLDLVDPGGVSHVEHAVDLGRMPA